MFVRSTSDRARVRCLQSVINRSFLTISALLLSSVKLLETETRAHTHAHTSYKLFVEFLTAMFQKIEVLELLEYPCQVSGERGGGVKYDPPNAETNTLLLRATQFFFGKNVRARVRYVRKYII